MELYLLRHANADTEAATDDARPLSAKGHAQAKLAAQFCAQRDIRPERLLTSPLPRAEQTAAPVAEILRLPLETVNWLTSGMSPATALREIKALGEVRSLMIVGHEPDFSQLAAHLLGLPTPHSIELRKGSLTALELPILRAGAATLLFSILARLM